MPIQVKTATGYKLVLNAWVKVAGVWERLGTVSYKDSSRWKLVHTAQDTYFFNQVISTNTSNYNMRDAAIAAGWSTDSPLAATVTINSGVTLSASSVAAYAFSTGSVFPDGSSLTLINNGVILGRGGTGGKGGSRTSTVTTFASDGIQGGPALYIALPTFITNSGRIAAGGGGGGGGRPVYYYNATSNSHSYYGGGGGGGGVGLGVGGAAGAATVSTYYKTDAQAGAVGSLVAGGAGGAGGSYNFAALSSPGTLRADFGGVGGGFGASGAVGSGAFSDAGAITIYSPAGLGGVGGNAVTGLSYITYNVVGTINGAQF